MSTAQPRRVGELGCQCVDLFLRAGGSLRVVPVPSFLQILLEFGEPAAVRFPSLRVDENIACIQSRHVQVAGGKGGSVQPGRSDDSGFYRSCKLQDVDLPARRGEQRRDISESFGVPKPGRLAAVPHLPILALASESRLRSRVVPR